MLQNPRSPAPHFALQWFTFRIVTGHFDGEVPIDERHVALDGQATFEKRSFFFAFSFVKNAQLRIEDHEQRKRRSPSFCPLFFGQSGHALFGIFEHDHGQTHANLRCGKAHAGRCSHHFDHGPNERTHCIGRNFVGIDQGGFAAQDDMTSLDNRRFRHEQPTS